jgi:gliding motility-associated-like protein
VFNGQTITQAGTYRDTLQQSNGCDSFIVLTVTILQSTTTPITRNICQGKSTVFNGQTITQAGTYRDTLQQVNGCDSFIVLTVTLLQPKTTDITRSICQGKSTFFNGQTITQAGTYRDTLLQANGCDSFIVLTVSIIPTKTTNLTRSICEGQSTAFNGQTITTAGTYRDTLSTSLTCDSFLVLTVTVNPKKATSINRIICQGQSITIGTNNYTQTGNYKDTLRSSLGCDSIVSLNLTVNAFVSNNLDIAICTGTSITIGTHTYNQSGNYSDTLKTSQNCDSIVNLKLLVADTLKENISRTICEGDTAFVAGQQFTTEGIHLINLKAQAGCDSLVILNLIILKTKRNTINKTICEGETFVVGTTNFNATGTYTITLISSQNCDSIVTLNLTVNRNTSFQITRIICDGESVTIGSSIYSTSGNYTDTLLNSLNCDSIIFLNLTVLPNSITNLTPSICEGSSFTVGDSIFTKTGNYIVKFEAANGCDSTINVQLTVHPNKTTNLVQSICEGETFTVGTQTFDTTGTFTVKLQTTKGCDSTVNLDLTLHPNKSITIQRTICKGESITIGNNTYSVAGNYIDTLQSSKGCDSVVNLVLTVNPTPIIDATVDSNVVKKGTQIQLNVITSETLNYNWLPNTVSQQDIKNPTAIVNTPTWYIVTATNSQTNCKSIDSVFVDILNLPCTNEYVYIPNAFSPNNDGVNDIFKVRAINLTEGTLLVYDRWGNKVFESSDLLIGWDGNYKGQPAQVDAYGYYFTGRCELGEKITLKGNVTLLR